MTDAELGLEIAIAVKEVIAPLQQRIKQLEAENIGLRAEFRLLKEIALGNREPKQMPDLIFPGESHARTRSLS